MEKLNRTKTAIKGNITKLETFVKASQAEINSTNACELEVKFSKVLSLLNKMEDLREKYYDLPGNQDLTAVETDLDDCETRLEQIQVSLKLLLATFQIHSVNLNESKNSENETSAHSKKLIKLPEIPLPLFSGKYQDWCTFKEQFTNLIVGNDSLNDSQKLYYLRASLTGEAKLLESADDNFDSLFKALTERFENHRLLIDSHLAAIINYEKIHIESYKELRSFIDCINRNLRALKVLKYEQNYLSEAILINLILQKVDKQSRLLFEYSIKKNEYPQFEQLMSFLENRAFTLEAVSRNSGAKPINKNVPQTNKTKNFVLNSSDYKSKRYCVLCKNDSHNLNKCTNFLKMNVSERFDFVKKNKICRNCLGSTHLINACASKFNCFSCGFRHNSLLHVDKNERNTKKESSLENTQPDTASPTEASSKNENFHALSNLMKESKRTVLLSTCFVYIDNSKGEKYRMRVILDSGSNVNCLLNECADTLGLKKKAVNIPVSGLNGSTQNIKYKTSGVIYNADGTFKENTDFVLVPKITDVIPATHLNVSDIELPPFTELADPTFFRPGKIHALIGAELFYRILKPTSFKINEQLFLQQSVFGLIPNGCLDEITPSKSFGQCHFIQDFSDVIDNLKQRRLEKERKFLLQQERLEQFTVSGKKSNINPDNLIDSIFGKIQPKKYSANYSSIIASKTNDINVVENKPKISFEREKIGNASSANKPVLSSTFSETISSAPAPIKKYIKELDSMMLECSNLNVPSKAVKFQSVKEMTLSSSHETTFTASDKARDWRDIKGLDEVFTAPKPRSSDCCNEEKVPELCKKVQAMVTTNDSHPPDTNLPFPMFEQPVHQVVRLTAMSIRSHTQPSNDHKEIINVAQKVATLAPFAASSSTPDDEFDDFQSAISTAINFSLNIPSSFNQLVSDDDFDIFKQAPCIKAPESCISTLKQTETSIATKEQNKVVSGDFLSPEEDKYCGFRTLQQAEDNNQWAHFTFSSVSNESPCVFPSDKTAVINRNSASLNYPSVLITKNTDSNSLFTKCDTNVLTNTREDDEFDDFVHANISSVPPSTIATDFAYFSNFKQAEFEQLSVLQIDYGFGEFTSCVSASFKPELGHDLVFHLLKDNISFAESQSVSSLELGTYDGGGGHSGESKSSLSRQGSIPSLDLKCAVFDGTDSEDCTKEIQLSPYVPRNSKFPSPISIIEVSDENETSTPLGQYFQPSTLPLTDKYSVIRQEKLKDEDPHISCWTRCLESALNILQNMKKLFNQMSCDEIISSEAGGNYFKNVIEVHKVICRVSLACKSLGKQTETLLGFLNNADQVRNTLFGFFAGSPLMPEDASLDFSSRVLKLEPENNAKYVVYVFLIFNYEVNFLIRKTIQNFHKEEETITVLVQTFG